MEVRKTPDEILQDLGGCGLYQWRLTILIHALKALVCWSTVAMVIMAAKPPFWCADPGVHGNASLYQNSSQTEEKTKCTTFNGSKCTEFEYNKEVLDNMVMEFNLVCDDGYLPSTIISIQLGGTLLGNVAAGHLAALFGRKPIFFSFICVVGVSNFVGFLSTSWVMFLVARVFIGFGSGCFSAIYYSLLSEFTLAKHRSWVINFPSWRMEQCTLALIAWLVRDWRYIQLVIALTAVPCLASWWFIPESFRWYIAHDRIDDAEKVIKGIATLNKVPMPSMESVMMGEKPEKDTKYTFLDLFKSKFLIRVTVLSTINWLALGLVSTGLSYGISALSGNIYLNVFLFGVAGIPSKSLAMWLNNKIGRRKTSMLCFATIALGGLTVGIVQQSDTEHKDALTNGFAILATVGVATAWGPVQTMTIELYPTVIRTIGVGCLATVARVGGIVGPQFVYLSEFSPGLLYFVCAGVATLCIVGLIGLPETMDGNLSDKIAMKKKQVDSEKLEENNAVSISDENLPKY